jgi:hypothetical protein
MTTFLPETDLHPSGVGALPHTDPGAACRAVLDAFPVIPYTPTLPARGILESIVFNDSEYLPGGVIRDDRLSVDSATDHSQAMEQILLDYLDVNFGGYAVGPAYNAGLHRMLGEDLSGALIVKTQVTGPVTFGMQVVDETKRPILYDPEYADVLPKMIALRARWCEAALRERANARTTLVVLNEPYLAALGSSVIPIDAGTVRAGIADVAEILTGALGIHCCSNTDWEFLMSLPIAVISFDAYQYAKEFLLYADRMAAFMEAGGVVAWGVVPAEYDTFATESVDSLSSRFEAIRRQACEIVDEELFARRSMITPTCGIRFADERGAGAIMQATAALSRLARGEGT